MYQPSEPHKVPTEYLPTVVELAEARLRASGYPSLRNVRCDYRGDVLVLNGRLPTYYLKQIAVATVSGLDEVHQVVDEIVVVDHVGTGMSKSPDF